MPVSAVFQLYLRPRWISTTPLPREDHATVGESSTTSSCRTWIARNRKGAVRTSSRPVRKSSVMTPAPMRTPLTDLLPEEYGALAALIDKQRRAIEIDR